MISSSRITTSRNASRIVSRRIVTSTTNSRTIATKRTLALTNSALRNVIYNNNNNCLFYTTERIIELRSGKSGKDLPKTLYNSNNEKENCGVGLIASLKSIPSRNIVEKADEMLVRMAHRGGCGCDPASGDGSGKLFLLL